MSLPHKQRASGTLCGIAGIVIFSGSLPATLIAETAFAPMFLTAARTIIAAMCGLALLIVLQQPRPGPGAIRPLMVVASGVVIGYPLLSACALQHIEAVRSVLWTGLLPLSTALFAVIRNGEKPSRIFWLLSLCGAGAVLVYAAIQTQGGSLLGDTFMLAAILACGLGYAEGAALSRTLGGWQVISWALLISSPVMLIIALLYPPPTFAYVPAEAWCSLAYVALFSGLLGFVFWYRALALGGVARIGQLQLLQPFGGLALSAMLLHEHVPASMLVVTLIVLFCVFGARRAA